MPPGQIDNLPQSAPAQPYDWVRPRSAKTHEEGEHGHGNHLTTTPTDASLRNFMANVVQAGNAPRYLAIFGDPQIHATYKWGMYRSLMIGIKAPGHRLPAMNLASPLTMEMMLREGIAPHQRQRMAGMVSTGDVVDVNNVEELETYFHSLGRLQQADPAFRVAQFMIGNHDVFHAGTTRSGTDFFLVLGMVLNLQGERSYKQDIHIPEVGGTENILSKEVLIKEIYREFYNKEPDPAVLIEEGFFRKYHTRDDTSLRPWAHTSRVFKDFWKKEIDGTWNALVQVDGKRDYAEQRWLKVSAMKVDEIETADGSHPIYMINLDTMDYLLTATSLAGLQGHVSPYQVKLVHAFIAEMKKDNPRARFIIGGHYPAKDIVEFRESGLNKIFSFESVIAYVAAHTHARGMHDLNSGEMKEDLGIERKTPLAEIVVPAVIDYPNEFSLMKLGVDPNDEHKFYLDVRFKGLNEEKIPGSSDAVCEQLKKERRYLLTFGDALAHIKDPQIAEFANPWTSDIKRIDLLLNGDNGILSRPGNVHDDIIANDVIPSMVEDAQSYLHLFKAIVTLALREAGLEGLSRDYEEALLERMKHLDEFYEGIWSGKFIGTGHPHNHDMNIDRYKRPFDEVTYQAMDRVEERLKNASISPMQKALLKELKHLLFHTNIFVGEYRSWLIKYEQNLRTQRDPKELINDADIFGSSSFKTIIGHIHDLPYGSEAVSFIVHAHLEAAEQYKEFLKGADSLRQTVPDRIKIEYDTQSGDLRLVKSKLPPEDGPIPRRQWCENPAYAHRYAESAREWAYQIRPENGYRGIEGHWSWKFVGFIDPNLPTIFPPDRYILSTEIGRQYHWVNQWNAPRVNTFLRATALIDGRHRDGFTASGEGRADELQWEIGGKAGVTVGPPWGILAVGPLVYGGFGQRDVLDRNPSHMTFIGVGGILDVLEGAGSFEVERVWYSDGEATTRALFGVDIFRLGGLYFNWWPRDF